MDFAFPPLFKKPLHWETSSAAAFYTVFNFIKHIFRKVSVVIIQPGGSLKWLRRAHKGPQNLPNP